LTEFVPRGTYAEIGEIYKRRYGGLTRRITFPIPQDPADDAAAAQVIAQLKTP